MLLQIHESVNQVNVALPVLLERETRFELATPTLARLCSTTELFPLNSRSNYTDNSHAVKQLMKNCLASQVTGNENAHRPQGRWALRHSQRLVAERGVRPSAPVPARRHADS